MSAEEEIQAGLANALERGVSIEKAVQSFINAGYPEPAVRSAARAVNEGNVSFPHIEDSPESTSEKPKIDVAPVLVPKLSNPNAQVKKIEDVEKKEVSNTKVIILVVVLVILLGLLVASFFFKDAILSLFP